MFVTRNGRAIQRRRLRILIHPCAADRERLGRVLLRREVVEFLNIGMPAEIARPPPASERPHRFSRRSILTGPEPLVAMNRKMKQKRTAGSPPFWIGQRPFG